MPQPEKSTASPLPSLDPERLSQNTAPKIFLTAAIALLAMLVLTCWRKIDSSALLFHLRAGKVIGDTEQLPNRDIFSSASSVEVWSYIEWLWSRVLALTFSAGEWVGLNILSIALAIAVILLMLRRAHIHGARRFESLIVTAFVMASLLPVFQPEPAIAALSLFVIALILAEARRLWPMVLLPILTMLWANMQAGFLMALLAPAARMFFPSPNRDKRQTSNPTVYLLVIIGGSLCAALITPHSVKIIPAVFGRLSGEFSDFLANPFHVFTDVAWIIRALSATAMIAMIISGRRTVLRWEICVISVLALFSILSPVALNFLLIYLSAPAALGLSQLLSHSWDLRRTRSLAGTTAVLAIVAISALVLSTARITPDTFGTGLRPGVFPETAAGRLASIPLRAAVLNPTQHAGYLIWRLWPNWKVASDERPTLYSAQFRREYEKIWAGARGWESRIALWRIHAILGTNEIAERYPNHNLFHELADSSDWVPAYWDSESILYLKSGINLSSTNLSEFRQLKPGLSWAAMKARIKTPKQARELAADLRRALMDDPTNSTAREFLRRTDDLF